MKILDLFCGAGGVTRGYQQACEALGIACEITGVDILPMPRYVGDRFVQADALEYLALHGHEYDFIHASPPCQAYSTTKGMPYKTREYPDLIVPVRKLLIASGKPYVIENVMGAPMHTNIILCGTMFGLKVYRHRAFESSHMLFQPTHQKHMERIGGYRPGGRLPRKAPKDWTGYICVAGENFYLDAGRRAMGIDWMNRLELSESIPPAYTRYIGIQLFERLFT